MKMTLYRADSRGEKTNTVYPIRVEVTNAEEMRQVAEYDHVCAEYRDGYRSKNNFIRSDCLPMDCDNDHSEDPRDWKNVLDVTKAFPGVEFLVVNSRNHWKEKHEKPPRPRFHVYFPCREFANADEYELLKKQVQAAFPEFDPHGLGAARFFFGVENAEAFVVEGDKMINEILTATTTVSSKTAAAPQQTKSKHREKMRVPSVIKANERNATITSLVGSLHRQGFPPEAIEAAVLKLASERCVDYGVKRPGEDKAFDDEEVRGIVASIVQRDGGELRILKDGDDEILGAFNITQACRDLYNLDPKSAQFELLWERYAAKSKEAGLKNFGKVYKNYLHEQAKVVQAEIQAERENPPAKTTRFTGQWAPLLCGEWDATDDGICRDATFNDKSQRDGKVMACNHPILPTERIFDVETGDKQVTLAFSHVGKWQSVTVPQKTIATRNSIVSLADKGIAISDVKSRGRIADLSVIVQLNYWTIPVIRGVPHLGWVKDCGFAPYVRNIRVLTRGKTEKSVHESLLATGNAQAWLEEALSARRRSPANKALLAASFASVLLEPLSIPSFFVHVYGSSGTGKSVGQMLAASVWGNPVKGELFQTLNSTVVGIELFSAFLRNLPVILDEAQTERDAREGRVLVQIYKIVAEAGRLRGTQAVTLADKHRWHNLFITSGEHPILSNNDGGGAYNRAIEIQLEGREINGRACAMCAAANYGHAGQKFLAALKMDEARELYEYTLKNLPANTSGKQATCVAILLAADQLACKYVYGTNDALTLNDILSLGAVKDENTVISTEARIIEFIDEWIAVNSLKFLKGDGEFMTRDERPVGEIYGKIKDGYVYIVPSILRKAVAAAGFPDVTTTLTKLKKDGRLRTKSGEKKFTCLTRLLGQTTRCICLKQAEDDPAPTPPETATHARAAARPYTWQRFGAVSGHGAVHDTY
ncbi:MAG: DUF927 domain-containing protein [Oscillospiraceae bacterium]|nr:DUF927 domain-containing protein [Oscillospiraceae bacterium]